VNVKGPTERVRYDFKRVWECPACHLKERTGGEVVARMCPCQQEKPLEEQLWMKLIQDGPRRVR
jgi:hypothetical protein